MKIFLAGANEFDMLKTWGLKHLLISYPCFLDEPFEERDFEGVELFLDSGAFSIFTLGIKIDLDRMIEDYKRLNWIKMKCGLDVIGDGEATKANCVKMKEAGLDIIPTFHFGEDYSILRFYLDNWGLVALGGVAQLRVRKKLQPWLDSCFLIIKDYWPKKIHGFAITASWALKRYPFYSVDSTRWLAVARYGEVLKCEGYDIGCSEKKLFYLNKRGLDFLLYNNVKAFLDLEKNITRLWESKGVIWS
jgi:hypothetical protein